MPSGSGYRRQLYRDDAVVLRVQKLGESDRIITLLTRRHGRLRAVARGVRRVNSRFGARLEPFGHIDLQLAGSPEGVGSSLHSISQVEGVNLFGKKFLEDYPRYTAASAIAETAERLTPVEREPSLRLFQLTLGALKALAVGEHATSLVLDAYLLRGMAFAGWAPAIAECAVCGEAGPHGAFSVPAGGSVCPDCRPPGAAHPAPATLGLMAALLGGDWTVADIADPSVRRECSGLVAAHLQWHMERNLRALPLVDRRESGSLRRADASSAASGDLPPVLRPRADRSSAGFGDLPSARADLPSVLADRSSAGSGDLPSVPADRSSAGFGDLPSVLRPRGDSPPVPDFLRGPQP